MKHGEPLTQKPAGPAGTGPQEAPTPLPPGVVAYEATDVKARSIAKALAALVVASIVVVVLLVPMFRWLRARAERREPPPPAMGRRQAGRMPAEPRLQTTPMRDLDGLLWQERRRLSSYGWVDEPNGIVHIPIDVAMQIIAERGLPAASPAGSPSPPMPASPAATPSPGGQR